MFSLSGESQEELYMNLVSCEKQQWKQTREELKKATAPFERHVPTEDIGRHEDLDALLHSMQLALTNAQSAIDRVTVLKEQYNLVRTNCDLVRDNCSRLTEKYHGEIGKYNPLLKHCFQSQLKRDIMRSESEQPILNDESEKLSSLN